MNLSWALRGTRGCRVMYEMLRGGRRVAESVVALQSEGGSEACRQARVFASRRRRKEPELAFVAHFLSQRHVKEFGRCQ